MPELLAGVNVSWILITIQRYTARCVDYPLIGELRDIADTNEGMNCSVTRNG